MSNLKLTRLRLKDLQGVESADYDLSGGSIYCFAGKNGGGKSTALRAVEYLLRQDKKPNIPKSIRHGQLKAEVQHEIQDEQGGTWKILVEISNKKGKEVIVATVVSPDGTQLDNPSDLLGDPTEPFDLIQFLKNQGTEAGRKKNLKYFEDLLGVSLLDMEQAIKDAEASRKAAKQERDQAQAAFGQEYSVADVLAFSGQKRDTLKAQERLNNAYQTNSQIQVKESRLDQLPTEIGKLEAQIKALTEKVGALKEEERQVQEFLSQNERVDVTELQSEVEEYHQYNQKVETFMKLKPKANALKNAGEQVKLREDEVKARRTELQNAIAEAAKNAQIPSRMALSMGDKSLDLVYVNEDGTELPFSEEQVQQSHLVTTAAEFGALLMKDRKLPVITVRDASLLDLDSKEMLVKTLEENGIQAFFEVPEKGSNVYAVEIHEYLDREEKVSQFRDSLK